MTWTLPDLSTVKWSYGGCTQCNKDLGYDLSIGDLVLKKYTSVQWWSNGSQYALCKQHAYELYKGIRVKVTHRGVKFGIRP